MKENKTKNDCSHRSKYCYRIELYPLKSEDDKIEWAAEIPELPGCVGGGDTPLDVFIHLYRNNPSEKSDEYLMFEKQ